MAEKEKIQKEEVNKENVTQEAPKAEKAEEKKQKKCKKDETSAKEEAIRKQLEELESKLAKEKDDYLRLMAEFETFRRRTSEEKLAMISSAAAETIKGLLPVLDDCERALEILEKSSDNAAKEGTTLIYNKLMDYLKTRGLARIEAKGETFDTDFHEAVTQFPAPSEEMKGKVIDVVQTGYTLNGKVLRYAKVVVGA